MVPFLPLAASSGSLLDSTRDGRLADAVEPGDAASLHDLTLFSVSSVALYNPSSPDIASAATVPLLLTFALRDSRRPGRANI